MGPVWDDDRTGMYHPSEKAARKLERRLGVGEDVERVKRRKRGDYERRRREKEREVEQAKAEEEGGGGGDGDGGSGATDQADGEEAEEQETATSASESEPRTSLVVTLTTTSETGKACLQALGVAGGRRTRKRFYEQPAEQSAAGPSSRKKARTEMPDGEASTQMSSTSGAIRAAPMEEGKDVAEVSTSLAGALTDMSLVETHEITPTPAEEFNNKNQDEIGRAPSMLTENEKGDAELSTPVAEVAMENSPIEDNAASSKPAEQTTDEIEEKANKVPLSLTWKTSHKKQTKLDIIFGISKGKPNGKKQSKIDKLFPVVKSQRPKKVFCTCRKPEFGFMIYCEGPCGEWYHGRCVGINAMEGKKMDKYFCECYLSSRASPWLMIWLGKSCTAASAAAPEDAAIEDVATHDAVEPVTAPDIVVEEAPKSATPPIQVEPDTAHVEDLIPTSSVTPAATPQDAITARLKYFSPSSVTHVTAEKPAAVQEPMVLTAHAPSNNAENSFAQILHNFTALSGGAIRFNFGSCKDSFED